MRTDDNAQMPDDDTITNKECEQWLDEVRAHLVQPPAEVQYPPLRDTLRKLDRFIKLVNSGAHQPHDHAETDQSP